MNFQFYCPAFIDSEQPPEFEFETKEELLAHPEIKRVTALDYHIRWEQITNEPPNYLIHRTTLMHICKGSTGEEYWVKGFMTPNLKEQWFPEWKYENYPRPNSSTSIKNEV